MKVTLYTIYTCDSGGYGRYPTNEYFLTEDEAKARNKESNGCYGWTSSYDAILKDGKYKTDSGREIFLFKSASEVKAMIKKIKSLLTPEEIFFVQNSM